jgi:hypothetical protein
LAKVGVLEQLRENHQACTRFFCGWPEVRTVTDGNWFFVAFVHFWFDNPTVSES